jgi:L-rhamnose-H+ transport protein
MVPPIFKALTPNFFVFAGSPSIITIAESTSGKITLLGVVVCLLGITIAAMAGYTKEAQMPEEQKKKAIKEFNFKKGILVATFCGVMSACFAFGLQAGKDINAASELAGTNHIWTGLPTLPVLLLGGFTTNFIWCVLLNLKNRSGYQYFASHVREEHAHHGGAGNSEHGATQIAAAAAAGTLDLKIPRVNNYLFSALAGTTWYFQFFFYTMGASQMGSYDFASWTLHMSSIIIFATMWGWIFHEWKGSSKKAHLLIAGGIATLILSTIVIGYGAYVKKSEPAPPPAQARALTAPASHSQG